MRVCSPLEPVRGRELDLFPPLLFLDTTMKSRCGNTTRPMLTQHFAPNARVKADVLFPFSTTSSFLSFSCDRSSFFPALPAVIYFDDP